MVVPQLISLVSQDSRRNAKQFALLPRPIFAKSSGRISPSGHFADAKCLQAGLAVLALRRGKARARKLVQRCAFRFPTQRKAVCVAAIARFSQNKNRPKAAFILEKSGAGGNRTHEYQFCRLTPYHLATAPLQLQRYISIIAKKGIL